MSTDDTRALERIATLRRARPVNHTARLTVLAIAVLGVLAWTVGGLFPDHLFEERARRNLLRFASELVPVPLRESGFDAGVLWTWIVETLERTRGLEAAWITLHLAILSIGFATLFAVLAAPLGARTIAAREPLDEAAGADGGAGGGRWRVLRRSARGSFVLMRALPEYVLAFLLMSLLPWSAWPAVLALAIHNGGILGRLQAETLENLPRAPLVALRQAGASRAQLAFVAGFPLSLGRLLLYVFYRYETCVREATVLGLLGISTLGYVVQDARSKLFYDEMALLIGLGVVLVLAADAASSIVRRFVRDA